MFVGERAAALIDWDLAGPGDERWDLAYAAWRSVPRYGKAFAECNAAQWTTALTE